MTRYQRSVQIWTLLIVAAKERKSYTYGDVAQILDMGGAGVLAQFLGPIMWYCEDHELPPLTVLVVNQETGCPSEGLTTLEDEDKDRERVFNYSWFSIAPPETKEFEKADRVRGSAPRSFRLNNNEGISGG
jgi:hypothetical protein